MKAFVIAVVLLTCGAAPWLATRAGAQGVDSCLKIEFPNHYFDSLRWETYMNDDSVLIDSCPGSPTYLEYYASQWWEIDFKYYVINRPVAPYDTTIELPWTVIDTSYSALRSSFSAMETKFGTFHLVELEPESYDSTANGSKSYDIVFDNYVCVDSVLADLRLFPDVDSTYGIQDIAFGSYPAWADGGLGGVAVNALKSEGLRLNPNPADGSLTITKQGSKGIYNLKILDLLGRMILDVQGDGNSELTLNIRSLTNGVYVIVCDNTIHANLIVDH